MRATSLVLPLLALAVAGCNNAGESLGLPSLIAGGVGVAVFVDNDASRTLTQGDSAYAGARVALFIKDGVDTFRVATTGDDGIAVFDSVPVGRYRFAVIPGSVGDSLPVLTDGSGEIRLNAAPDSLVAGATALVGFPELTVAEVRAATAGRRVFLRAIVSAGLQSFTDSSSFVTTGAASLRITHAMHRPGRNGNNPGDSVLVFGTTGSAAGQPVLLNGLIGTLAERPAPVPEDVSVAEVRNARGGALDAALVRVSGATIADTATVDAAFRVRVADGADTATVWLDPKLQAPTSIFVPGRTLTTRGVLVPNGDGTWWLRPRPVSGEIVVN